MSDYDKVMSAGSDEMWRIENERRALKEYPHLLKKVARLRKQITALKRVRTATETMLARIGHKIAKKHTAGLEIALAASRKVKR